MKTFMVDNNFYIIGGKTSQGNPIIITPGYIKECVKSLKTLGFKESKVFAKFSVLEDRVEGELFDLYKGTHYKGEFLEINLSTHTVSHPYKGELVTFKLSIDDSYMYEGAWKYRYLNNPSEVKISFK